MSEEIYTLSFKFPHEGRGRKYRAKFDEPVMMMHPMVGNATKNSYQKRCILNKAALDALEIKGVTKIGFATVNNSKIVLLNLGLIPEAYRIKVNHSFNVTDRTGSFAGASFFHKFLRELELKADKVEGKVINLNLTPIMVPIDGVDCKMFIVSFLSLEKAKPVKSSIDAVRIAIK